MNIGEKIKPKNVEPLHCTVVVGGLYIPRLLLAAVVNKICPKEKECNEQTGVAFLFNQDMM